MANVIDALSKTLENIKNVIDPIQLNFVLESLTTTQLKESALLSTLFCNNNGNYRSDATCDCDIAFFGSRCFTPGMHYWKAGWTALQVLFSMFYVILSIMTWSYLNKYLKNEYGSFCNKIRRLFQTPKYLVILNLIIICNTRIIYVTVDPFKQKNIFDRRADRILHELIFSSSLSMFFILLIVWMGLYSAFDIENKNKEIDIKSNKSDEKEVINLVRIKTDSEERAGCFRHYYKFKNAIIVILFFIYPCQITFSYFRGMRSVDPLILDYVLLGLLGLIIIFIIVFIYYTLKLKLTLSRSYDAPNKNHPKIFLKKPQARVFKKMTNKVRTVEMKEFLKKVEEKSIFNLIVNQILNPNDEKSNDNEDSDSELDYEDEMDDIDLDVFEESSKLTSPREEANSPESISDRRKDDTNGKKNKTSSMILANGSQVVQVKKSTQAQYEIINEDATNKDNVLISSTQPQTQLKLPKKQVMHFEKNKKEFVLTEHDMNVLNKIFGVSYLIIFVAFFLAFIGLILKLTSVLTTPNGTIVVISFSFIFELITIIAIFYLFVRDIENKEYDNLKIIGDIEKHLKRNQDGKVKLKFNEINDTDIYYRLKNFMNIETPNKLQESV